jgi:choline dehydrogenase
MVSHARRADLDNWGKLGNPSWNFDTLQPYYSKSETYNPPDAVTAKELGTDILDPALHGNSGPIQTNFPVGQGPLDQAWGPAFKILDLDPKQDPRKGDTLGGYSAEIHGLQGEKELYGPRILRPQCGEAKSGRFDECSCQED